MCHKKADYYCSQTKDPVCGKECKQRNLERIEKEDLDKKNPPASAHPSPSASLDSTEFSARLEALSPNPTLEESYRKDVFVMFLLLCNLSKPNDDLPPLDYSSPSNEVRGRILALELLLSVLTNPGPVFRTTEMFIGLVKKDLCLPLSKNGASSNCEPPPCSTRPLVIPLPN